VKGRGKGKSANVKGTGLRNLYRGFLMRMRMILMRKRVMLVKCLLRILRMSESRQSTDCKTTFLDDEATLLYMRMFLCHSIHGFLSRPIPYAHHSRSQNLHHNHRAKVSARKHIPSILLRSPQSILQQRMKPSTPQQSRSRPHNPRVKLIVQRPRTQHSNRIG
jgi:hypothetical protein